MYKRLQYNILLERLSGSVRRIQIVSGPRGTGKTTMVKQVAESLEASGAVVLYASADMPAPGGSGWIEENWHSARLRRHTAKTVLIVDEVQKIQNWSETVVRLWSEELNTPVPIAVVLLDSSDFSLPESIAQTADVLYMWHWSFKEMKNAFGFSLEQFLLYGGYPGGAGLIKNYDRWRSYILDRVIETAISRDILMINRVEKPVLLRNLFMLACKHPCKVISYTRLLAVLQDGGNTTTLAGYLDLLSGAGLVAGLKKFSGGKARKRSSSPQLVPLNNALVTAMRGIDAKMFRKDYSVKRSLLLNAIGAAIHGRLRISSSEELHYWKSGDAKVDFVYPSEEDLLVFEIVSENKSDDFNSLAAFRKEYPFAKTVQVGNGGVSEEMIL